MDPRATFERLLRPHEDFDPFDQYAGKGPRLRQPIVEWFHNNRLADFAELIEPGDRLLSVGSGNAELEAKILSRRFDQVHTLEIKRARCATARAKGLGSVQASGPPLPFERAAFDAVVAAGTMEHLPDERGFIEEAHRCLKPGGTLYVTLPVEVGIGGFVRHLGQNFVNPTRADSPEGLRRYLDYTMAELTKTTARHEHGTTHRYYNYVYAVDDMKRLFANIDIQGWPVAALGPLNLILFVTATTEA